MYTDRDTAPDPVATTTAAATANAPRGERAYGELKTRLLLGEFGLNRRLGEERLANLLGVSRTPVREALTRLHADGLVAKAHDGGYLPTVPDAAAMRHLYEARIGIELQALHRPGRIGSSHDVPVLDALHQDWVSVGEDSAGLDATPADPTFVLLDEDFHLRLVEAAGNPVLCELLRQVNERIRIVRMQDFLLPERLSQTVDEHLAIVEAVQAGRIIDAEVAFTRHIDRSLAVVEERVERVIARMAKGGGDQ